MKIDEFSFLSNWLKNEKLDVFMEYAVQQIRWFQEIYMQLDDFNKFVNWEILLDDFSFFQLHDFSFFQLDDFRE